MFKMESDDGSLLWFNNTLYIDNDGTHDRILKESGQITVEQPGRYPFHVEYFNGYGPGWLKVWWAGNDVPDRGIIPADYFLHDPADNEPEQQAPIEDENNDEDGNGNGDDNTDGSPVDESPVTDETAGLSAAIYVTDC